MDLAVASGSRGRGTGKMLIAAVKDWARARGLGYLELNVLEGNEGARRLYEREEFRATLHTMRCLL